MFESSLFINGLSRLFKYIAFLWRESATGKTCGRFAAWFMRLWNGSAILGFFRKDGYLSRIWEHSKALSLFDWLLNIVPVLLSKIYSRFTVAFDKRVLFRAVRFLSRNVPIFIALFIAFDLVYPDTRWDNRWSTVAALGLFGLFLIDAMTDKKVKFAFKIIDVFLFIFMLSIVLAQVFSVYPSLSLRSFVFYGTDFMMMLLLASSIKTKDQLATVIEIILAGAAVSGIYGLYQGIKGVPVIQSQVDLALNQGMPGRVFGAFDNSNTYSQVIVMILPFFAAVVMSAKGWQKKLLFAVAAVPLLIALFMTYSRSGWVGFAFSALVLVFLVKRSLIPLFFALGIVCMPFLPQSIQNRIATITNTQDTSTSYRFDIFKTMWGVIKNFWYTGLGLDTNTVHRVTQNYEIYSKSLPVHAHNIYLQIWLETGIVGLLSFLGTVVRTVKRSLRIIYDKNGDPYLQNVLKAGISGLLGVLVIALVEYVWFYARVMLIFWVLMGLILAAIRLSAQKEENEKPAA